MTHGRSYLPLSRLRRRFISGGSTLMLPGLLILRKNVLTVRGNDDGGVTLANLDVTPGLQEAQCHRHQPVSLDQGGRLQRLLHSSGP